MQDLSILKSEKVQCVNAWKHLQDEIEEFWKRYYSQVLITVDEMPSVVFLPLNKRDQCSYIHSRENNRIDNIIQL